MRAAYGIVHVDLDAVGGMLGRIEGSVDVVIEVGDGGGVDGMSVEMSMKM